jgi:integrase
MPEFSHQRPTYKTQTAKGTLYAYSRVNGRKVALGRAGTPVTLAKLSRLQAEWDATRHEFERADTTRLTVAEVAERFIQYESDRTAAGLITDKTLHAARTAANAVVFEPEHAMTPAATFGPKSLRAIQTRLRATPCDDRRGRYSGGRTPPSLSRGEVNRRVNLIRRMFRWAICEELVPASVLTALETVPGLRAGEARDNDHRAPADPVAVAATIADLARKSHHGMAELLALLRWTGCRPDEGCRLTAADVFETPEGPELRIQEHKTRKHTGADRIVPLNARAAGIVRAALERGRSLDPSRRLFLSRSRNPLTPGGLFQAVRRAAAAAGVPHWTPYQLRHLSAIEMIEAGATEAEAAAAIGHTPNSTVIRRYSRGREKLARRGADRIGARESA